MYCLSDIIVEQAYMQQLGIGAEDEERGGVQMKETETKRGGDEMLLMTIATDLLSLIGDRVRGRVRGEMKAGGVHPHLICLQQLGVLSERELSSELLLLLVSVLIERGMREEVRGELTARAITLEEQIEAEGRKRGRGRGRGNGGGGGGRRGGGGIRTITFTHTA